MQICSLVHSTLLDIHSHECTCTHTHTPTRIPQYSLVQKICKWLVKKENHFVAVRRKKSRYLCTVNDMRIHDCSDLSSDSISTLGVKLARRKMLWEKSLAQAITHDLSVRICQKWNILIFFLVVAVVFFLLPFIIILQKEYHFLHSDFKNRAEHRLDTHFSIYNLSLDI